MSTTNSNIETFPNITKSPSDRRQYLGLKLPNNLKVLLVSDPETDLSAVSLTVHVGSMCDPWDRQGLAHLLEHLLFMGSEKYPTENDYTKFLSQHGGSSNASTTSSVTNFFFDINPDHLAPALDRFTQFFLAPCLSADSISRELASVHSEFILNLESDSTRMDRIFQLLSIEGHDYRKFTNGNNETLGGVAAEILREELVQFWETYYSANLMTACVLGKESISDLQSLVVSQFSSIPNKNIPAPKWSEHPFGTDTSLMKLVRFVPVMDLQSATIRFRYPDDLEYYQLDPSGYLVHLFNNPSPKSLLTELKDTLTYCSYMSARSFGCDGFGFFEIDLDLTEEGFDHWQSAIETVFAYISFLKSTQPQEYLWEEIRALRQIKFNFAGKTHSIGYVSHLAYMLQYFPFEKILSAYNILEGFDSKVIQNLLGYLEPENCSIVLRSPSFIEQSNQTEALYGIKYSVEPFSSEFLECLQNAKGIGRFELPPANRYIPTDFSIVPAESKSKECPELVKNLPGFKCWYFRDALFETPKVFYGLSIFSPAINESPEADNAINLFILAFKAANSDLINEAENAGLSISLTSTSTSIQLELRGYSHKMNLLLQEILQKLVNFRLDLKTFDIQKEDYSRTLLDYETLPPLMLTSYYHNLITCASAWSIDEKIEHLPNLTLESLERIRRAVFGTFGIEVYCHGNLTKDQALVVCDLIETQLFTALHPTILKDQHRPRQIMLEKGCSLYYPIKLNSSPQSKAILMYFEIGFNNLKQLALLKLIRKILDEPFYDQIRTKQQLGYSVQIGSVCVGGVCGLVVSIESSFGVGVLEEKIEEFLVWAEKHLTSLTESEFASEKASLITKILEKDKNLAQIAHRMWTAITCSEYDFRKREKIAKEIGDLSLDEVGEFFKKYLSKDGELRRKLVITFGENEEEEEMGNFDAAKRFSIVDIEQFKRCHLLYPVLMPTKNSV